MVVLPDPDSPVIQITHAFWFNSFSLSDLLSIWLKTGWMLLFCLVIFLYFIGMMEYWKSLHFQFPLLHYSTTPLLHSFYRLAINQGLSISSLLYCNSFVSSFANTILPPEALTMACPAAVSHSEVGAKRG